MLTDRAIKSLKPADKDQFVSDGGGLYLRVTKSGKKAFYYKDQRGGKTRWVNLGDYPQIGLLDAREKAIEQKRGQSNPETVTVESACYAYLEHMEKHIRRPEYIRGRFKKDLIPALGKKPISRVTRNEVFSVLESIVKRGAPIAANRTLTNIKGLFDYALNKGIIHENPVERISRKFVGGSEYSRERNLSFNEIENFLQFLKDPKTRVASGVRSVLYFSLLTGCRVSEAIWCLQHRTLEIPETVAKVRAHRIPSTPHTQAALRRLGKPAGDHKLVSRALRRRGFDFTPHDLRRTFASRLSDLGVMPHVIEKLLNHQMEGVMAVYNRAEYWPERVEAQRLWGRKLAELRRKKTPGAELDGGELS